MQRRYVLVTAQEVHVVTLARPTGNLRLPRLRPDNALRRPPTSPTRDLPAGDLDSLAELVET